MKGLLGKILRKLRIDNNEYLKDMAEKTGVSVSYLSAVENETKKISESLINKIIDIYKLDKGQEDELRVASIEANKEVSINTDKLDDSKIDLTYHFARYVDRISPEAVKKIKDVLKEEIDDWSYCFTTFNERN